ncbi:uncharacterized protein [Nicotiana sylvestris]|uniref:uncharacterized protein n=1 Tax=Nicotiana sylvestris TaxID=4096 RepID=UPI00388CC4B1
MGKSTLALMVVADIFRALTACKAGGKVFEGCEKNRLAKENEALRAQIRQLKITIDKQPRSRSDEQLVKRLESEVRERRDELGKSEKAMAELKAQWATRTEERRQYLNQLKRDHEKIVANLKRKVVALEGKAVRQARDFETESRHCYNLLAQMEAEVQQLQDQHLQDSRALKTCSDQIRRLLIEKKRTKDRIRAIAHAIIAFVSFFPKQKMSSL